MSRRAAAIPMHAEFRSALIDDLDQLIRLHDRELDAATLLALKSVKFPRGLALAPDRDCAEQAHANLAAALSDLPDVAPGQILDELAADYAAIYLNNSLGASPYESVWLDDEHLACQQPMFELREIYAAAGFKVTDWRRRFDEHLGFWLPDFARRVALNCNTGFYAALAELTHVWLTRLRGVLDEMCDRPVPAREVVAARIHKKLALDRAEVAPIRFMPGAQGPSW